MTLPFTLEDLLDDPGWRAEMEKSASGRRELARLDAQRRAQELRASVEQGRRNLGAATAGERQRLRHSISQQEQQAGEAEAFAQTGRGKGASGVGNAVRGFGYGAATAPASFLDMLLSVPDRVTGGALQGVRGPLQNFNAAMQEAYEPSSSVGGQVGEFAGSLAGGIPLYGRLANAVSRPIAAGVQRAGAPVAADMIRAAAGRATTAPLAAPGRVVQGLANVATGLPITAYSQLGMEGVSGADRLRQGAIETGADLLFGSLLGARPGTPLGMGAAVTGPVAGPSASPPTPVGPKAEIAEKFAKTKATTEANAAAKAEVSAARKEWESQSRIDAQRAYTSANPGKFWTKLPREERDRLVKEWREAHPFVDPNAQPAEAQAAPGEAPAPAALPAPVPEVAVPRTEYPIGTVLRTGDGTLTRQSEFNWRADNGQIITDSQVASRPKEEFELVPGSAAANEADIFIPSPTVGQVPKEKRARGSKEKVPMSLGIVPGMDEGDMPPVPVPGPPVRAQVTEQVDPKAILEELFGKPPGQPETITSYRGYMTQEGETNGMATEGAGLYVSDTPLMASLFAPDGYVTKVVHQKPKKPVVVTEEELYYLNNSPEIKEPVSPDDSVWLKANKLAYQAKERKSAEEQAAGNDFDYDIKAGQEFGVELSKQLKAAGYDAVRVQGKDASWWVLLDDKLKVSEQKATWDELAIRHDDPSEAEFWKKVDNAVAGETLGSPPSVRALLKEKYGSDQVLLSDAEYLALPDDLLREYRKRFPARAFDEEGNEIPAGTVDEEITRRRANNALDSGTNLSPSPTPVVEIPKPVVEAPPIAATVDDKFSGPIDWWTRTKPSDRIAALKSVGWEPASKLNEDTVSRMRFPQLSGPSREAAERAFTVLQQGGELPKAPPKSKRAAAPEQVQTASANFTYSLAKLQRPAKLSDDELSGYIAETQRRLSNADEVGKESIQTDLNKLLNEEKERKLRNGKKVQNPAAVSGAAGGMLTGIVSTDEDDPDYASKVLMWTLAGAAGGFAAQRLVTARIKYDKSEGYKLPTKPVENVVSIEQRKGQDKPILERTRDFYNGFVRSIGSAERVIDDLRRYEPDLARRAKRNMGLFGHYISNTQSAFTDRLVYRGVNGEPQYITKDDGSFVWSLKRILNLAENDKNGLGDLAVAMRVLERDAQGIKRNPISVEDAQMIFQNAPDHMVQAAKELREFHLGIAQMLMLQGRITEAGYNAMRAQEWYTPFYHIMETGEVRSFDSFNSRNVGTPNPLKAGNKGSKLPVMNPVDQTIILTPRFLRAIEFGQVTQSLVDLSRAIGDKDVRRHFMYRVKPTGEQAKYVKELEAKARATAQVLGVTADDIAGLVVHGDVEHPAFAGGYITNWENGQLNTYWVNPAVFDAMKSLIPMERDLLTGLMSKGASWVSRGVVNSPVFVFNQFFKDSFETAALSRYGFVPLWDSARALKHIYTRSPEYRRMLDMGGPGTIQSLQYLDPEKALRSLEAEGENALAVAWRQMREMHPIEAYKTLALPFAEAARVGEYLRALDHNESTIEAVYAAWNVLGNTRIQGASPFMRKLNAMTPFLRASLAAIDELGARSGTHLLRGPEGASGSELSRSRAFTAFVAKGISSITMPTLLFWAFQKDDEELRQLRNTTLGQRYWFIRPSNFFPGMLAEELGFDPNTIIRIPRPHSTGVMFGALAEHAADDVANKDPAATEAWAKAFIDQFLVNAIPSVVGLGVGLASGYDLGLRRQIVSDQDKNIDPALQGHDKASFPGRVIGGTLGQLPMVGRMFSPPMVDFIVRSTTGMAGQDVLQALTLVQDYLDNDYVPAKYELPVMRGFFVKYPTTNVSAVEKFYRYADKAEGKYNALQHLTRHDPEEAARYIRENISEIQFAGMLTQVRRDIAGYRRASTDITQMSKGSITPQRRRELEAMFAKRIVLAAQMAVNIMEAKNAQAQDGQARDR
jgi:hypothetical protein